MTARQRISFLREHLNYCNHKYYIENAPVISDFEFDTLLRELQDLEAADPEFADPNSPTVRVGSDITNEFRSIEHSFPMLSLSNTYSLDELHEWIDRVEKEVGPTEFVCELKFDGTAISLTYEHGRLLRAVTRGDGTRGDDVTENVRTIRSVPLVLTGDGYPDFFEIRGEILMPYASFDRLNTEREAAGEPPFANPRNAAAGTLKQQQSHVVARRGLDCTLYQLAGDDLPYTSHWDNLEAARRWGFRISDKAAVCRSREQIDEYIKRWDTERKTLPFPTDGVVVKVNRYADRRALGSTAKAPKWAVAYKFKAEQALTRLLKVTYQVGRTGAITPVANLEPVLLAGTTVKRATLHNADQIAALDIRENDMVYVEKGGEIIPKITAVDLTSRPADSRPLEYITECPECGAGLVRYEGEAKHYCPNQSHCRPQILGRIIHFISRKAMNIESLGEKIITRLFEVEHINNIADLYCLTLEDISKTKIITRLTEKEALKLLKNIREGKNSDSQIIKKLILNGTISNIADAVNLSVHQITEIDFEKEIGKKTANKIIENLTLSKSVPFHRVLFALGIHFVGETTAKYLAVHFRSLDAVMSASREELTEAEEVGDKITDSIMEYFADEQNRAIIERLRKAGLQFEAQQREAASDTLAGLSFVISGTFAKHSRDELKAMIEAHGGKNLAAVSANTSYLLAGDKIGPSKLQKATKLGIKIISEQEFMAMTGPGVPQHGTTEQPSPEPEQLAEQNRDTGRRQEIQGSLF